MPGAPATAGASTRVVVTATSHALPELRDRGNRAQATARGDVEKGVGRERADPPSEIGRQVHGKRSGAKEAPDSSPLALLTAPVEAVLGLAWPQRLQTLAPASKTSTRGRRVGHKLDGHEQGAGGFVNGRPGVLNGDMPHETWDARESFAWALVAPVVLVAEG